MDLTDEQWALLQHLIPQKNIEGPGRPPLSPRRVLEGILWKLRTAAPWDALPSEYPSYKTCYRYYWKWRRAGILDQVLTTLSDHLQMNGFVFADVVRNHEIEIRTFRRGAVLQFSPQWQGTWQSSTAQLFLQIIQTKIRKSGRAKGKLIPVSSA